MATNSSHRTAVSGDLVERVFFYNGSREDGLTSSVVQAAVFGYVAPVLIVFGTFGNLLSVAVLQSKSFRKSPATFVLSVLALTDVGVLLCGLLRHFVIEATDGRIDIRTFNAAVCCVHVVFTYYLCQLSSWTLLLVTLERMASVKWPLRAKRMFTTARVVAAWSLIAVALALLNSHWFQTIGLVANGDDSGFSCTAKEDHLWFIVVVWPWMDFIVLSLIPLIIIFACNIIIINALLLASRRRTQTLTANHKAKESTQITVMLIGLNVIFLLATFPVSLYFIGEGQFWDPEKPSTETAYVICNIVYYLSNSTNFLIYCVTGSRFRGALADLMCRKQCQKSKDNTSETKSQKTKWRTSSEPVTLISVVFKSDLT